MTTTVHRKINTYFCITMMWYARVKFEFEMIGHTFHGEGHTLSKCQCALDKLAGHTKQNIFTQPISGKWLFKSRKDQTHNMMSMK